MTGMERWNDGEGGCGQAACQEIADAETRSPRSSKIVCQVLSCCRGRTGANSVPVGSYFCSNYRAVPQLQATVSGSRERQNRHRTKCVNRWVGSDTGMPTICGLLESAAKLPQLDDYEHGK